MATRAALVLAATLLAAPAHGEPCALADYRLDAPGFVRVVAPAPERLLACADGARLLIVVTVYGATDGARPAREPFYAGLERGLLDAYPGAKRLDARRHELGKGRRRAAALDLWIGRAKPRGTLGARFLLYEGRAVVLLVEDPTRKRPDKALRRVLESFKPRPPP